MAASRRAQPFLLLNCLIRSSGSTESRPSHNVMYRERTENEQRTNSLLVTSYSPPFGRKSSLGLVRGLTESVWRRIVRVDWDCEPATLSICVDVLTFGSWSGVSLQHPCRGGELRWAEAGHFLRSNHGNQRDAPHETAARARQNRGRKQFSSEPAATRRGDWFALGNKLRSGKGAFASQHRPLLSHR